MLGETECIRCPLLAIGLRRENQAACFFALRFFSVGIVGEFDHPLLDQAQISCFLLPGFEFLAHAEKHLTVVVIFGKVVYLPRVRIRIVKLFHGPLVGEHDGLGLIERAFEPAAVPFLHDGMVVAEAIPHEIGSLGKPVLDVFVAFVAHRPDHFVVHVAAVHRRISVLSFGAGLLAEKRLALHMRRHGDAAGAEHGGAKINRTDQAVAGGAGLDCSRPAHDHGRVNPRIIKMPFAPRHRTMITPVHHDRVVSQAILFELFEQLSHHLVTEGNVVVVLRDTLSDPRRIREVGRYLDRVRVGDRLESRLRFHHDGPRAHFLPHARLVGIFGVEDGEKRHRWVWTVAPVRTAGTVIPGGKRQGELIVRLDVIRAVVAFSSEILTQTLDEVWDGGIVLIFPDGSGGPRLADPHVMGANTGGIHPRNHTRPRGGAYRRRGERVGVNAAFRGQPVDIRRSGYVVAIAAV